MIDESERLIGLIISLKNNQCKILVDDLEKSAGFIYEPEKQTRYNLEDYSEILR